MVERFRRTLSPFQFVHVGAGKSSIKNAFDDFERRKLPNGFCQYRRKFSHGSELTGHYQG